MGFRAIPPPQSNFLPAQWCAVVRRSAVWCGVARCSAVRRIVPKVLLPNGNGQDGLAHCQMQAGRAVRLSVCRV